MKNWRRKLRKIFTSRGSEKSPRIVDSDSLNMMEKRKDNLTPHHRSLPSVPNVYRKQMAFPTSYRGASDWLDKNQPTIDRALQVIEQYPDLIKQKSCERLREFGARIALKNRNGTNRSAGTLKQRTDADTDAEINIVHLPQMDTEDNGVSVPEILVSQPEDDELSFLGNKPKRVFVCGYVDNDLWHRLLVDLCKKYSIRCMAPSDFPECSRWLSETDVFLFLMDDVSVREYPYQDQLRIAVMLDLNIVYVRDLGFELKTDYSLRNIRSKNAHNTRTRSQGNINLNTENGSFANLLHPNKPVERKKSLPSDSTVVDIETDEKMSLPQVYYGKVSPPPYRRTKSSVEQSDKGRQEVDVAKITKKEYGTALVYHHLYHSRCLDRIIFAINNQDSNLTGQSECVANSRHSLLTPVSNCSVYSGFSCDSAVADMYHSMTPEPIDPERGNQILLEYEHSFDETSIPRRLSSPTETIFLVCPSVGDEKPKVFHWPEDVEKEIISNSPSVESLGFQDIDLSKRINQIDLFEENISD